MASVVAGGLFNAVAFAVGYLFIKLNIKGHTNEIKRHNHALKKLAQAKQEWYETEVERKDHIAQLREELAQANKDMSFTNKALVQLKKYEGIIHPEPKLSDFYQPSDEMKH